MIQYLSSIEQEPDTIWSLKPEDKVSAKLPRTKDLKKYIYKKKTPKEGLTVEQINFKKKK